MLFWSMRNPIQLSMIYPHQTTSHIQTPILLKHALPYVMAFLVLQGCKVLSSSSKQNSNHIVQLIGWRTPYSNEKDVYITLWENFSCGVDSMLHYMIKQYDNPRQKIWWKKEYATSDEAPSPLNCRAYRIPTSKTSYLHDQERKPLHAVWRKEQRYLINWLINELAHARQQQERGTILFAKKNRDDLRRRSILQKDGGYALSTISKKRRLKNIVNNLIHAGNNKRVHRKTVPEKIPYDDLYEIPGTVEHDAHSIRAPILFQQAANYYRDHCDKEDIEQVEFAYLLYSGYFYGYEDFTQATIISKHAEKIFSKSRNPYALWQRIQ